VTDIDLDRSTVGRAKVAVGAAFATGAAAFAGWFAPAAVRDDPHLFQETGAPVCGRRGRCAPLPRCRETLSLV